MNICSPEKKISRLVSVKPYQRKLKSLKPNPRSLGGKILPLPSLPKYRLKVKALGANSSLYATFQWCVGGQCVGNVPIYAHQSFSKPNTEKWTKGQDFSDTPFFAIIRFSTILIGTSIQWKAEVLRMFLLALECFQLSAIPGTKRYFM